MKKIIPILCICFLLVGCGKYNVKEAEKDLENKITKNEIENLKKTHIEQLHTIDENNNFEHLCENMRNGDSLIICGVDDIGNTKDEIEETWRRLRDLNIEIYVLTAPMLFQRENMTLEESFIRDVSLSVLASQVEIANQKLKAINDL